MVSICLPLDLIMAVQHDDCNLTSSLGSPLPPFKKAMWRTMPFLPPSRIVLKLLLYCGRTLCIVFLLLYLLGHILVESQTTGVGGGDIRAVISGQRCWQTHSSVLSLQTYPNIGNRNRYNSRISRSWSLSTSFAFTSNHAKTLHEDIILWCN